MRASGRTTRALWTALLYASGHNDVSVAVEVPRSEYANVEWTFRYLRELVAPIANVHADTPRKRLTLPNGSTVQIIRIDDDLRGVRYDRTVSDL